MPPLLLLSVLLLFATVDADAYPIPAAESCKNATTCGDVTIAYPFWLNNSSDSCCGYPGLGLHCDHEHNTTLFIVGLHRYRVRGIDYDTHTITLADTDADAFISDSICPRIHNLTIDTTSSELQLTTFDSNITILYNCKKNASGSPSALELSLCLQVEPGYNKSSYLFPDDGVTGEAYECDEAVVVPVLEAHKGMLWEYAGRPASNRSFEVLSGGFQLRYNPYTEQCGRCERSNGWCGYRQNQTLVAGGLGFTCFCSDGPVADHCTGSRKSHSIIIGAVVAGGVSALLIAGAVAIVFIRKRKQKKVTSSSKLLKYSGSGGTPRSRVGDDEESGGFQDPKTHLFSYEELEEATDSFNDSRELGDGGFGTVYKGYLRDGRVVAVKRLYNNNYRRVEQFVNEAAILSRLRHPNLVMFYGCTSSHSRELLLVYEFVPNGTVADHLHGHRAAERALTWPLRLKIAVESAAALTYLHAVDQPIVHRDVKTTNILLDADFHVKVADFGLSRLFPLDATHVSTAPQGTPGYVDPEYHQCYQLTDKSDVYSFGVVLVELISSKPAVDITRQRNEINLAGMAISKIQKCKLEELVDVGLGYDSDPETRRMMTMVAELAFRCLQQNGEMRPPIKEVLEVLRGIQDGSGSDKHNKDTDALVAPFSPDTVHAPWESRSTTPNTSQ